MKIRNVLSLFDGMRCGAIALDKAGIEYDTYFASEIDKYAIQIAQKNYPEGVQLGNVNDYEMWEYIPGFSWDSIDLVMGGSPCQDLSIAKKDRKGLEGERSGLFWTFVEILKKAKPKYFLLENVASMSDKDRDVITEIMGVEPIMINSALVSAQQRKRYYWTNLYVTQPNDRKIFLRDIIECGKNEYSVNLNSRYGLKGLCDINGKSKALVASGCKGYGNDSVSLIAEPCIYQNPRGKNNGGIHADKSPTLTSNSWEYNNKLIEPIPCVIRTWPRQKIEGVPRVNRLEARQDVKCNSLTTKDKDSLLLFRCGDYKTVEQVSNPTQSNKVYSVKDKMVELPVWADKPVRIASIGKGGQGDRVYSTEGKSVSLNANGGDRGAKTGLYKIDLPDGDYIVRKLTPLECERLQTVPEGYTEGVSNTQRYKMLGNGWTVDVIAHILSGINLEGLV